MGTDTSVDGDRKDQGEFLLYLTPLRILSVLTMLSAGAFCFLFPSLYAGIAPLICGVLALAYTFWPRSVEVHFHKKVTVAFIFSVSLLMAYLIAANHIRSGRMESIHIHAAGGLLAVLALVIGADLVFSFKKLEWKWALRILPVLIYTATANLFLTRRSANPYLILLAVAISGGILSASAWFQKERKWMSWFYLYAGFLSTAFMPALIIMISRLISQPVPIQFSCHAASVRTATKRGFRERGRARRVRLRALEELEASGEISREFAEGLGTIIRNG